VKNKERGNRNRRQTTHSQRPSRLSASYAKGATAKPFASEKKKRAKRKKGVKTKKKVSHRYPVRPYDLVERKETCQQEGASGGGKGVLKKKSVHVVMSQPGEENRSGKDALI